MADALGDGCAIHQGDAFDLVCQLADGSVDLVLTSPPYWGLRTYEGSHNWSILEDWKSTGRDTNDVPGYDWYRDHGGVLGLEPLPEWYAAHLTEFFSRARRKIKPHGSVWVNVGDTYFARWSSIRDSGRQGLGDQSRVRRRTPMGGYRQEKQLLLVPFRFAAGMQDDRWILRNDLIWHKPNVPPRPEKDRLRLAHEHFFHFVHRPSSGRANYYYDLPSAESGGTDVVTCSTRPGEAEHSATFPRELIAPRIASSCPPGGTVLDPFCGSGRAVEVACALGRRGIGFELAPKFADHAASVLRKAER